MNEQLIVKNFGPIKDATVDFKKVTVFIGPTGGGKSTLAKLAAVFRDIDFRGSTIEYRTKSFDRFSLTSFFLPTSWFHWIYGDNGYETRKDLSQRESIISNKKIVGEWMQDINSNSRNIIKDLLEQIDFDDIKKKISTYSQETIERLNKEGNFLKSFEELMRMKEEELAHTKPHYFPSNRAFIPTVEYSWPGLIRDDIGMPKDILDFANNFSTSRKDIHELDIVFLNAKYIHHNGQDFIKVKGSDTLFRLYETASGIQSVTPLLVLLEHLSRQKEQARSYIIEEPELNLYPTAQQGLLNWLVAKCTAGENDLTITTHSPYILASCNLLMEAYKVWQDRSELESEIEKIVPRTSWINPEEFAAYYVADGTVRSIQDERTDLIGGNELDAVSGHISDAFRSLLRLKKQPA